MNIKREVAIPVAKEDSKMRHYLHVAALVALAAIADGGGGAAGEPPTLDKVIFKGRGGGEEEKEGVIFKDDYIEVKMRCDGAEFGKTRDKVVRVAYGAFDQEAFQRALGHIGDSEFDAAKKILDNLEGRLSQSIPEESKRMLPLQHIMYQQAICLKGMAEREAKADRRKEIFKQAQDICQKLLAAKPDTVYFYDVKLLQAQCIELAGDRATARGWYENLWNEFRKKIEGNEFNERYVFLARLAYLRLEMEAAVAKAGQEDKARRLLSEIEQIKQSQGWQKYSGPAEEAEAVRVVARALLYLKEYEKLISALNTVIRQAVREDDRELLASLYEQRAAANYALWKEKGEDKEYGKRALTDYLRVDLMYELSPASSALANCRIAEILYKLRMPNWKSHALEHLAKAKSLNDPGMAQEVDNLLREVRAAEDTSTVEGEKSAAAKEEKGDKKAGEK